MFRLLYSHKLKLLTHIIQKVDWVPESVRMFSRRVETLGSARIRTTETLSTEQSSLHLVHVLLDIQKTATVYDSRWSATWLTFPRTFERLTEWGKVKSREGDSQAVDCSLGRSSCRENSFNCNKMLNVIISYRRTQSRTNKTLSGYSTLPLYSWYRSPTWNPLVQASTCLNTEVDMEVEPQILKRSIQ